jgi:hypothetical protein
VAKRLNVNLGDEVYDALEKMAQDDGLTVTEALRRSISTEAFIRAARSRGERVLLLDPKTKETREIVFR